MMFACGVPQRLEYSGLVSEAVGKELEHSVYTPPGWTSAQRLPLVLFLHGAGDDAESFDAAKVGQYLDIEMGAGRVPRAVIALPQGDVSFWENWYDGTRNYRDYVMRELLPHVRATFNTANCPEHCHVMGISMGGHGALRIAEEEPGAFATVTSISGLILSAEGMDRVRESWLMRVLLPMDRIWGPAGDPARNAENDPFQQWLGPEDVSGARLALAWGTKERAEIASSNERFARHLKKHNIPVSTRLFDGGHRWVAWTPVIGWALRTQL